MGYRGLNLDCLSAVPLPGPHVVSFCSSSLNPKTASFVISICLYLKSVKGNTVYHIGEVEGLNIFCNLFSHLQVMVTAISIRNHLLFLI